MRQMRDLVRKPALSTFMGFLEFRIIGFEVKYS